MNHGAVLNHKWTWVVPACVFSLFDIPIVIGQLDQSRPWWLTALIVAGHVLYTVAYILLPLRLWTARLVWQLSSVLVMMALAACLAMVSSPYVFIWAFILSAVVLPTRMVIAVNGAVLLVLIAVLWAGDFRGLVVVLFSVTTLCRGVAVLMETNLELRRAQDRIALLARAEERTRVARDLHDVLGHSLTTITVKAGLARRILETSTSTGRAVDEMRDVEQLSKQALADIKATVSGERNASLAAELVGAKAALRSAGIAADFPLAVDDVAAAYQESFAYALREGVTNVLRHSTGATRCEVRLGGSWLEVRDDGDPGPAGCATSRVDGGGNGLSGLSARLADIGAELEVGPLPQQGFRLRVNAPEVAA